MDKEFDVTIEYNRVSALKVNIKLEGGDSAPVYYPQVERICVDNHTGQTIESDFVMLSRNDKTVFFTTEAKALGYAIKERRAMRKQNQEVFNNETINEQN